jgi:hypothetical protein
MPAKSFWVIVAGRTPTAFRARFEQDLIPTLRQLQRTQPDVAIAWYERHRLWASPNAAKEDLLRRRKLRTTRGKEWRPGGKHVDPRQRYERSRDEKRKRWAQKVRRQKPK